MASAISSEKKKKKTFVAWSGNMKLHALIHLSLAKKAEAKPRQIKVNVGSERTFEGKETRGTVKAA